MKRLFLLLAMVGLFATACQKSAQDGTDGDGGAGSGNTPGTGEKKLVKIVCSYEGDEYHPDTNTYRYDNQGRLVESITEVWDYDDYESRSSLSRKHLSIRSTSLGRRRTISRGNSRGIQKYTSTTQYEWSDSTIKVIEQDGDYTSSSTFTLNNGLVQSCSVVSEYDTFTENYYYDGGRLVRIVNNQDYGTYCTWDGDKLTSVKWDGESDVISLTYNGTCKKGYNPLIEWFVGIYNDDLLVANPEVCGVQTKQLFASYSHLDVEDVEHDVTEHTFSYKLDKDGYISKVTMRDSEGYSTVCALTWE